jgi:hypothetical protein
MAISLYVAVSVTPEEAWSGLAVFSIVPALYLWSRWAYRRSDRAT